MSAGRLAGGLTAGVAGIVMAAISAYGGSVAASLPAILLLTVLLTAGGLFYGSLLDRGRLRPGLGPGVIFWTCAFPLARLLHVLLAGDSGRSGLGQGFVPFLVYQAMVGGAFGLGFVLLHNQLWSLLLRLRGGNEGAEDSSALEGPRRRT